MTRKYKMIGKGQTAAPDSIPDAASFGTKTNVARSTLIESDPLILTGLSANATISSPASGTYSINGGTPTSAPGTYVPGQTLRRQLLSSSFYSTGNSGALLVGGTSIGFSTVTQDDPSVSIPLVGPHAAWTGAAGSGKTPTVDPVRTTAKPAASWWSPTLQRVTDDLIVGVIAGAKGGIANVRFEGDVADTTLSGPSVRTYIDANGVSKKTPLGYWITLDHSLFIAKNAAGGKINIYAVVTATDGTMQVRVIGGPGVDGSDNLIENKPPQQQWIRPLISGSKYDWEKTIGIGGNYADWASMRTALRAASPKSPHITIITSGIYVLGTSVDPFASPGGQLEETEGYCVVDAAPGIDATLVRSLTFDPRNEGGYYDKAWFCYPGCNQIKFTGAGITLDTKNFQSLNQTNNHQPYWFDGCRVINSIGQLTGIGATYWNGGPALGWGPYRLNNNPVPAYYTDMYSEYVQIGYGAYVWANNTLKFPQQGRHDAIRLNVGNYERGATYLNTQAGTNRMTGVYVGAAATAVAKVYGYLTGCKVELVENGVLVKTVTFPNGAAFRDDRTAAESGTTVDRKVSSLVTELNTRSGWTFTMLGDDTGWASSFFNNGGEIDFDCKNVTRTWACGKDDHTEYGQARTGPPTDENFIVLGNIIRDAHYSSAYMLWDRMTDLYCAYNVFDIEPGGPEAPGGTQIGNNGGHVVFENNWLHGALTNNSVPGQDAYSSIRQNIAIIAPNKPSTGPNAGTWPAQPGHQDNLWAASANGPPSGINDTGNITVNEGSDAANKAYIYALFTDRTNGDYRPTGHLIESGNLRNRRSTVDGQGYPLDALSAIGPWALGRPAPTYPF